MLKTICASLFPIQPKAFKQSLPTQKVTCPSHSKHPITSFCLKPGCPTPYICSSCKNSHPKGHSKHFTSLQSLFDDQFTTQYAKHLNTRFSTEHIESSHREVISILNKLEDEVVSSIRELKRNAEEYYNDLSSTVERLRKTYREYTDLSSLSTRTEVEPEQVKQLLDNYRILKQDIKVFDLSLEAVQENLQREVDTVSHKFKYDILGKLKANMALKPIDFSKLKIKTTIPIPASEGVLYEACAFIPKWKTLAVGFRKTQQGSLGLFNLDSQELASVAPDVHKRWINHVIWLEKRNFIVTCSNDMKIKVFAVSNEGKKLKEVATFRGHTNLVRCIKYIDEEDLLVSAGDDPDIKLWDMKALRRSCTISTNCNTNMDGSIAYIPKDKLIGVGFRTGFVRFYHIYKRTMVMEFKTGFENFYTYGLQYLPKRKLILGRVKEHVIKVWKYDDEKKKVEPFKTINAKGSYPDCIVPNEDESQLLFTSRDQFLESYDFANDKTSAVNLNPHIKKTNALVFLESMGKVSVCDYTSGQICILH